MDSNSLQIPTEIHLFLISLLKDAGMETLEDDMRAEMEKELFARLETYITSRIVETMPADKLDAFVDMNEQGKSQEEIDAYIQENIPNAQQFFADVFLEFRDMYLSNVALVKEEKLTAPVENSQSTVN